MKQADAKRKIISLWAERDRTKLTRLHIIEFSAWIGKEHPELLKCKIVGDPYQKIKEWVLPYVVE